MVPEIEIPYLNVSSKLREYGLHPKKGLGQNFLSQPAILEQIVASADVQSGDQVLEVGPGIGSLTRYLAAASHHVVAVELDQELIPILSDVLAGFDHVKIVQGDILKFKIEDLMPSGQFLVVANIPYLITSALIRHLLEATHKPQHLVLTIQREVAERICAVQGKMSLLSLSVQVYGKPKPVLKIPASAFYPSPKVDSTALRIDLYPEPVICREHLDVFFRLAKAGFGQKRKMLKNSLANGLAMKIDDVNEFLSAAGIDGQRRAETLTLTDWNDLVEGYLTKGYS